MISAKVREMVEQRFADPVGDLEGAEGDFRQMIYDTLEAGESLYLLGQRNGCGQQELVDLKAIQEAHRAVTSSSNE